MIIGLAGLAGSGKSTAASFLSAQYGFSVRNFADPLKLICQDLFRFSDEQLWGPSQARNQEDARYGQSARDALQTIGAAARKYYPDVWVQRLVRDLDPVADIVIGDVRYVNEVRTIAKLGGQVWYVHRPGIPRQLHESEQLTAEGCDYTLNNTSTIEDLKLDIALAMQRLPR